MIKTGYILKTNFNMIYFLKYDIPLICKKLVQEQLKNSGLDYRMITHTEIEIKDAHQK